MQPDMRAYRYLMVMIALVACFVFTLKLFSAGRSSNSPKLNRRVDKHFFFELLQQFDTNPRNFVYNHSFDSSFNGLMDRNLLARYLADRFAYTSFIQFGGCNIEAIHQFMPDTVKSPGCIESQRTLDSILTSGSQFELILVESWSLTESVFDKILSGMDRGGTLVILDSNPSVQAPSTNSFWDVIIRIRQRGDLDMATLDNDGGMTVVHYRRNSKPLNLNILTNTVASAPAESVDAEFTLSWDAFLANKAAILNLVSFESLHDWLA